MMVTTQCAGKTPGMDSFTASAFINVSLRFSGHCAVRFGSRCGNCDVCRAQELLRGAHLMILHDFTMEMNQN